MKEAIIAYLTDHIEAKVSSISEYIGMKRSYARDCLSELTAGGTVISEGGNRNRTYRLKCWSPHNILEFIPEEKDRD